MAEFQERADQLSLDLIDRTIAFGGIFKRAKKKLLEKGAKLLVGPRGTGKTHIMRYTYLQAIRNDNEPLALYATFNEYLRLEPLLKRSPDALTRFHSWVLAKLLLSCFQLLKDADKPPALLSNHDPVYDQDKLESLVALLERHSGEEEYQELGRKLTIGHVTQAVDILCRVFKRDRAVLLLDDAALSLADQYLAVFFDIYRRLKTEHIAPKASVYPGSTQYGPTFHASHEAEEVELWLSVEDPAYSSIMGEISYKRIEGLSDLNSDVIEALKYLAFGIPRAYLRLLREFSESKGASLQQKLNKIIERQTELIAAEYDSMGMKLPQFRSVIASGREFFDAVIQEISRANPPEKTSHRIYVIGIQEDPNRSPLAERMLRLLVEVGMLYPLPPVSHGVGRKYNRYIPHFAFLQHRGVFRSGRGWSPRDIPEYLMRPAAKHPLRRELTKLLSAEGIAGLKLGLPPCQHCKTERLNDSQLFCHNCGKELAVASLFEECMKLPLEKVPNISSAMVRRIHKDTAFRTVGDLYVSQKPLAELQQAMYVGPIRANDIITKVYVTINEFLS